MTDGAGQSFPGHTRCRVAIDTGALSKALMIILVYAARISEVKRFPLSLSLLGVWVLMYSAIRPCVGNRLCVGGAHRSYVASAMDVGESGKP